MTSRVASRPNPITESDAEEVAPATSPLFAAPAAIGLLAIGALAFSGAARATSGDKITLLFLGIVALLAWLPSPRLRAFCSRADVASFFLTACAFIVYGLARQVAPPHGFALRFPILDDSFILPYAEYAVLFGALFSAPRWWKHRSGWTNALLGALAMIAVFAAGSFWFLGRYLKVGETEELDPRPMIVTLLQVVEYGLLTLCCAAVSAHPKTRVLALRVLSIVLLLLWARHTFFTAPPVDNADE